MLKASLPVAHAFAMGFLLFGIAGCSDAPAASPCESEPCPSTPTEDDNAPLPTQTPPPISGSLPFVVFTDCHGLRMSASFPADTVRGHVPAEFLLVGGAPLTVLVAFTAFDCGRATYDQTVATNVQALWTHVFVEPTEDAWNDDGRHYFTYDALVSDEALAKALGRLGVPAARAEFDVTANDLAGAGAVEGWTVEADALSMAFEFKHSSMSSGMVNTREDWHWWFGEGPFSRLSVKHEDTYYDPVGSEDLVARVDGTSTFHRLVGDVMEFGGTPMYSLTWVVDPTVQVYAKEES